MSDINLYIDTIPYLPDIFTKDDIYSSADGVNYNTQILSNNTIFIFNIDSTYDPLQYNDPLYLLFGVKDSKYQTYVFPPLYFFNIINNVNQSSNYSEYLTVQYSTNNIINGLNTLLTKIGYNVIDIDTNNFNFQILLINDCISKISRTVYYLYFSVKNLLEINYNNYYSNVFYNNDYYNVLIYPFVNSETIITGLNLNNNINFNINEFESKSLNIFYEIYFENKDLLKYLEKIDYKYMEKKTSLYNKNNKLLLLNAYSKNIKNFENFVKEKSLNSNSMIINLNEINMFFSNIDYQINYKNTYSLSLLNNNHLNKYLTFSNTEKKYSFSMDCKLGIIYKTPENKYSSYYNPINNPPSIYQLSKNYYVNSYFDVTKQLLNQKNGTLFYVTNRYLYKILLIINPKIISYNYLISQNYNLSIEDLLNNNNKLKFGAGPNKINLFLIESEIKFTNTFYVNKYKIVYSLLLPNGKSIVNYIILSIYFYNGLNININNTDITANSNDLAFVAFTTQDYLVSLAPTIFNLNKDKIIITEDINSYEIFDVKNYFFKFNYTELSKFKNLNNFYYVHNYYFFIPNFTPEILYYTDTGESQLVNNLYNININKINNFVLNMININDDLYNFMLELNDNKLLLITNIVYDTNLPINLVYNYSYFYQLHNKSNYPLNINNYIEKNNINNNLIILPSGYYKVFNKINFYPLNTFLDVNLQNDLIVENINIIPNFLKYNFALLIKLPNNSFIDNQFWVENYNSIYYDSNYSYNLGNNLSCIYLVISNSNNELYVNTQNIIYALPLFNQYNSITKDALGNSFQLKINLLINNYLNFYEMHFFIELYKILSEKNNLLLDVDNLYLDMHKNICNELKDVVYYDYYRFNYKFDSNNLDKCITKYENTFANNLYNNKFNLNITQLNIKRFIFVLNSVKNIDAINKILCYLKLIKNFKLLFYNNYYYLIDFIKYNIQLCNSINNINNNLNITFSTNNSQIQNIFFSFNQLTYETPLENIVEYINNLEYVYDYINFKMFLVVYQILKTIKTCNYINKLFEQINYQINIVINKIFINFEILNIIQSENQYLFKNVNLTEIKKYCNYEETKIIFILNILSTYVNIILLNTNKIDELFNLVKLMYIDRTIDSLYPEGINIVKNNYIYNTDYYNNQLQTNNFNYTTFLSDLKTVINYFADPLNSNYIVSIIYLKAINENIIHYIDETINYFTLINQQIIGIYKFINNINTGSIQNININDATNIANFYYILSEFSLNYTNLSQIIILNRINLFEEFDLMIEFFKNLVSNIKEYLFSVQIKLNIMNLDYNNQEYFFEDIIQILNFNEVYLTVVNKINNFIEIFTSENNNNLKKSYCDYIKNIYYKENINYNYDVFKLSKLDYNSNFYIKIKEIIFNLSLNNDELSDLIDTIINYSNQTIVFNDYNINLFYFQDTNYNFTPELYEIILEYNSIQKTVFDIYFNNDNDFYKQLINYNYITTPFTYVNIDNTE